MLGDWTGFREVTYPDLGGPERVNWVDYQDRTAAVTPAVFALRVEQRAADHDIWFVWSSGQNGLKDKCERIGEQISFTWPNRTPLVQPNLSTFEHAGLTHYRPPKPG
jgi:hypothetical protein